MRPTNRYFAVQITVDGLNNHWEQQNARKSFQKSASADSHLKVRSVYPLRYCTN